MVAETQPTEPVVAACVLDPELPLGTRIQLGRDRATVRYTGPVAGQEGSWVGVEWDDSTRGKHDGSSGGVRYFAATSGPAAGSFLRREKVPAGASVLAALKARYNNEAAEFGDDTAQDEMYVFTLRNNKVPIKMIGECEVQQHQRQTQRLTSARLVGAGISYVGDAAELAAAGANIAELDLTCNLVTEWDFVTLLAHSLPKLEVLNLSDNRLALPTAPCSLSPLGLRSMVLNNCGIQWHQLLALEPLLPHLEELHIGANGLTSLAPHNATAPGDDSARLGSSDAGRVSSSAVAAQRKCTPIRGFAALQVLNLQDNQLSSWQEIERLACLPSLSKLHLSNNPLPHLRYPAPEGVPAAATASRTTISSDASNAGDLGTQLEGASTGCKGGSRAALAPFGTLCALYLGGCNLTTFSPVDELDRFPQLREVRLSGNPVLAASKTGGRYEVIARVARLSMLNGAEVKPHERQDSELRYLQHVESELQAATDEQARAAVLAAHPRLPGLLKRYGQVLGAGSKVSNQGSSLAASLYELKLTCIAVSAGAKMGTQVKKLPRSTTLGALRQLCEKLFRVPAPRQALALRKPWDPALEELPSDDDGRQLTALGVQDGYEVVVDDYDPDERQQTEQAAKRASAAELALRSAGQLKQGDMLIGEFARSIGLPGAAPMGV